MDAADKKLRDLIEQMIADGLMRDGWAPTRNTLAISVGEFARERANNIICVLMNEREMDAEDDALAMASAA